MRPRLSLAIMTRRRARAWLGAALVVAVLAVGVQLVRNQWAQQLRRLRTSQLDFLPEVAQRIQNFRRVKMDGDRKVWEVAAREAQYFEEDGEIVVQEPEVSFYLEDDGGVVAVKGRTGRIILRGRDLDRVELEGGIEVRFREYVVRTDRAVYDRAADTVVSSAPVTVRGDGVALAGRRMTLEMEAQRVRLDGDVETVLRNEAEAAPDGDERAGTL